MDIYLVDGINGITDIVEPYSSVVWNMQYFGVNDFELTVPGTAKNIQRLQIGRLLVRSQDATTTLKNVMMIEKREIDFDAERGWTLILRGSGLKKILGRRIVWSQTNLSGTVESGIRQVITDNIISPSDTARAIPNFVLADAAGLSDTFEVQLFGENIAEWLSQVCEQYNYGWDVVIESGYYKFVLYKGTDRSYDQTDNVPVVFSPDFDNLARTKYISDNVDFANVALVGGEGEGTDQRSASTGSAVGLARYETYVDGSSVSSNGDIITLATYLVLLQNYGQQQLSSLLHTETMEGEIIQNGMYTLDEDYFLGDVVQIDNSFVHAKSRITEIIYSEDENGVQIIPTFSDYEVQNYWVNENEIKFVTDEGYYFVFE